MNVMDEKEVENMLVLEDILSMSLKELLRTYLERNNYTYLEKVTFQGADGQSHAIDFFLPDPKPQPVVVTNQAGMTTVRVIHSGAGILVRDWKRSVGTNVVLQAERIREQVLEVRKMMILCNYVGELALKLAERLHVFVVTKDELIRVLSTRQ